MKRSVDWITVLITLGSLLLQVFCSENNAQCTDPAGKPGQCMPLHSCPQLAILLRQTPIPDGNVRLLKESRCSSPNTGDPFMSVCCPIEKLPKAPSCGFGESDRLIGGQLSFVSEFAWSAIIEYRRNTSDEIGYHCGATLISSIYALTAAHCVRSSSGLDWEAIGVRFGEHDLSTRQDCEFDECAAYPVTTGIEKIIVHEGYSPQRKEHYDDIALIRLDRDVSLTSDVVPVCLPIEESDRTRNITGTWNGQSVGWGLSEAGTASHKKLKTGLSILDRKNCLDVFGTELRDTQICTEIRSDRETCAADSGGSLIIRDRSRYGSNMVYGIASFGKHSLCGTKADPAVFTDVTKYIEWIESNIDV